MFKMAASAHIGTHTQNALRLYSFAEMKRGFGEEEQTEFLLFFLFRAVF